MRGSIMSKYVITKKADIGTKGPGQYVLDLGKGKRKVITVLGTEEKTEQAQKHLTDVHALLEPAKKRGLLRHAYDYEGEYDDIPPLTYEDALNTVAKAEQMFDALPRDIKNKHGNNPSNFLAWAQDPANGEQMLKMGILKGNDGLRADGSPSGAPKTNDLNANGIPDKLADGSTNPADSPV